MQIHVEWTFGVIRLLTGDYGSPYIWSATVHRQAETLTIMGVDQMPENPHVLRTKLRQWCKAHGITRVKWDRYKPSGRRAEIHSV